VLASTCLYALYATLESCHYLRQGGYVFVVVCLFVSLSVSNFAQKLPTDLLQIFTEGWQWASEQTVKFWWRSGSPSEHRDCFPDSSSRTDAPDGGTDVAKLVRRALAEVCSVSVLLVNYGVTIQLCYKHQINDNQNDSEHCSCLKLHNFCHSIGLNTDETRRICEDMWALGGSVV